MDSNITSGGSGAAKKTSSVGMNSYNNNNNEEQIVVKNKQQLRMKKMFMGIVEAVHQNRGDCFKIRFSDPLMVLANVTLARVKSVLPQQTDPDFDRLAKEAHDYAYRNVMHRDVIVQIQDINEIGTS